METMIRNAPAYIVLIVTVCAHAAATELSKVTILETLKLYDGSDSQEEFGRLRLVNPGVQVFSVNGRKIGAIVNSETGKMIHEAHVKPGEHKVLLKSLSGFRSYGSMSTWKEARKTIVLNVEQGHVYTFSARREGNKMHFGVKDHGADYDAKCGGAINTDTAALANFFDIYSKGRIPIECY